MAAQKRTSEWVTGSVSIKPETIPDSSASWNDLPLDFSSKKRLPVEPIQDDAASDGGRSSVGSSIDHKSRADSPPVSMLAQHRMMNPLLRQASMATPLDSFFQFNQKLAALRYNHNNTTENSQSKPKNVRPFKAYPRDPLSMPLGFSGFPMGMGMSNGMSLESLLPQMFSAGPTEDMLQQDKRKADALMSGNACAKKQAVSSSQGKPKQSSRKQQRDVVTLENSPLITSPRLSPPTSMVSSSLQKRPEDKTSPADSSGIISSPHGSDSKESGSHSPNPSEATDEKKPARSVPDDTKDASYWERRRKNNEAAKRSRDARRQKEDAIALRAELLERENMQLRMDVARMKAQIDNMRAMF